MKRLDITKGILKFLVYLGVVLAVAVVIFSLPFLVGGTAEAISQKNYAGIVYGWLQLVVPVALILIHKSLIRRIDRIGQAQRT